VEIQRRMQLQRSLILRLDNMFEKAWNDTERAADKLKAVGAGHC